MLCWWRGHLGLGIWDMRLASAILSAIMTGGPLQQPETCETAGEGRVLQRLRSQEGAGRRWKSAEEVGERTVGLTGVWLAGPGYVDLVSTKAKFRVDGSASNPQVPLEAFSGRLLLSLPLGMNASARLQGHSSRLSWCVSEPCGHFVQPINTVSFLLSVLHEAVAPGRCSHESNLISDLALGITTWEWEGELCLTLLYPGSG